MNTSESSVGEPDSSNLSGVDLAEGEDTASREEVICSRCSQINSFPRLWCVECRAPITCASAKPVIAQDRSLTDRGDLYRKILEEIEHLFEHQEIDEETYHGITAFHQSQLLKIEDQIATQELAFARQNRLRSVTSNAHAGRLEEAIRQLKKGIQDDPDDRHLASLLEEVSERFRKRELARQKTREARTLYHEAKECLASLRLEEAQEKLQRATQLEPSNKQITAAIQKAESLLKERVEVAREPAIPDTQPACPAASPEERSEPSLEMESAAVEQEPLTARSIPGSFAEVEEEFSPTQRFIEAASQWSAVLKPFLLDNVGWFVGAFLVIAGFVVLIVTFWSTIEQNQILMHSLVFASLFVTTGMFFAAAYFMRLKYPQLETSSNVLLVIVALLIPLVFAAAILTALVPSPTALAAIALLHPPW